MIRRMAFWNERSFFRRTGDDGKPVLSTYPQESLFKIIDEDKWWSDSFDTLSYGRDYDFSRPFFDQLKELASTVPFPHRAGMELIDSEYSNNSNHLKNCYMCFNSAKCEDSLYCVFSGAVKNCIDILSGSDCELCYNLETGSRCHKVFFASNTDGCINSWLMYNCNNCSDCLGCVNLHKAQYHIFNKPYSKEEYFKKLGGLNLGSHRALEEHKNVWHELMLKSPRKYYVGIQNVNSIGDLVAHSKDAKYCYEAYGLESVAYSQALAPTVRDSYDFTNWGVNAERVYEAVDCGIHAYDIKFSFGCSPNCKNIQYSLGIFSSSDCFGCVATKKAQYCILNKQYSKEEYEALIPKIVEHMNAMPYIDALGRKYTYGEFFPPDMAPYAANETALLDFTDLDEEKSEAFGLIWRETKTAEYKTTIQAKDLPDNIKDAGENITKEIIACAGCERAYRIIPTEFTFYKTYSIPIPRKCHNCRFKDRVAFRNLPKWYPGKCKCGGLASANGMYQNTAEHPHGAEPCPNTFETTYAPDRPEIIYCEKCYQQEVV
jgi:hypothetical protein